MKHSAYLSAIALTVAAGGCERSTVDYDMSNPSANIDAATVAELQGIYRMDSFTHQVSRCDEEGESLLGSQPDSYVVIGPFGAFGLLAASCSDLDDCRDMLGALEEGASVSFSYGFRFLDRRDDSLSGTVVWTGYEAGGMCVDGRVEENLLTVLDGGRVRIEQREAPIDTYPAKDGVCWSDDAGAAPVGECAELLAVTATPVE